MSASVTRQPSLPAQKIAAPSGPSCRSFGTLTQGNSTHSSRRSLRLFNAIRQRDEESCGVAQIVTVASTACPPRFSKCSSNKPAASVTTPLNCAVSEPNTNAVPCSSRKLTANSRALVDAASRFCPPTANAVSSPFAPSVADQPAPCSSSDSAACVMHNPHNRSKPIIFIKTPRVGRESR